MGENELLNDTSEVIIPSVDNPTLIGDLADKVNCDKGMEMVRSLCGLERVGRIVSILQTCGARNPNLLDVGCGNGQMGIWLAGQVGSSLVLADVADYRDADYQNVPDLPFLVLKKQTPPRFGGEKVGAVLVVNVLQHIGYGHGYNPATHTPDPEGAAGDMIAFLEGLSTALDQDGLIIVATTHNIGNYQVATDLPNILQGNPLSEKVVFC